MREEGAASAGLKRGGTTGSNSGCGAGVYQYGGTERDRGLSAELKKARIGGSLDRCELVRQTYRSVPLKCGNASEARRDSLGGASSCKHLKGKMPPEEGRGVRDVSRMHGRVWNSYCHQCQGISCYGATKHQSS